MRIRGEHTNKKEGVQMKNTNCIFNWSDNPEPCKNKTKDVSGFCHHHRD